MRSFFASGGKKNVSRMPRGVSRWVFDGMNVLLAGDDFDDAAQGGDPHIAIAPTGARLELRALRAVEAYGLGKGTRRLRGLSASSPLGSPARPWRYAT